MAGNSIGNHFRVMTFGESHGRAIGAVIDGVRPGIPIDLDFVQKELSRRRPGQSAMTTSRVEADQVEILSGVFEGKSTGTPICMVIWNRDQQPKAYEKIKDMFRPGHAGYTYLAKFGVSDYRGGGRSSGRETAARVAAGAVAKQLLAKRGVEIIAYTLEVAGIRAQRIDYSEIEKNPLRSPDPVAARKMEQWVLKAKEEGDSVGGIVEIVVKNPPVGLGEPVFDKLEADLSKALMSIGAIKGVEVGNGFMTSRLKGSQNNDPMYFDKKAGRVRTRTNNAGGI
ncbi:chorismate synthase, partial [bacterium]